MHNDNDYDWLAERLERRSRSSTKRPCRRTPNTNEESVREQGQTSCIAMEEAPQLPGCTYMLPNKFLGFENRNSSNHPVVFVSCCDPYSLWFSQGTSEDKLLPKYRWLYPVVVLPDDGNGLLKATAFKKQPGSTSFRRVFQQSRLGRLSDIDLQQVRTQVEAHTGRKFP